MKRCMDVNVDHRYEVGERRILPSTTVPWVEDALEKVKVIHQRIKTV